MRETAKFAVGDRVRLANIPAEVEAKAGPEDGPLLQKHLWRNGTTGTITRVHSSGGYAPGLQMTSDSAGYSVRFDRYPYGDGDDNGHNPSELVLELEDDLTETEVLQLFGITPAAHCPTCTCHTKN